MKILAVVYGSSLAHVSRALEVAKTLRERKHQVHFAGKGQYLSFAREEGFPVSDLPCIPEERIKESVRTGRLSRLFREEELELFVREELALYEKLAPDLLLVDTRVSASTSAEIAGLRRVTIMNAHMSLFRSIPFSRKRASNDTRVDRLVNRLENRIEFLAYDRFVIEKMNRIRRKNGLRPQFSFGIEHGDLTLLSDVPEFNPTEPLPSSFKYVGPLVWHNSLPAPESLKRLDPAKSCVYFTIGSAGLAELVSGLKEAGLERLQFVVAIGDLRAPLRDDLPKNVFIERFVNADLLLPHCDAVVCHGGNGTIYQALSHGLPVLGVSMHAEQHYGLKRVNHLRLGKGFTAAEIQKRGFATLIRTLREVLADESYRQRAREFQRILRNWDPPRLAADLIEEFRF